MAGRQRRRRRTGQGDVMPLPRQLPRQPYGRRDHATVGPGRGEAGNDMEDFHDCLALGNVRPHTLRSPCRLHHLQVSPCPLSADHTSTQLPMGEWYSAAQKDRRIGSLPSLAVQRAIALDPHPASNVRSGSERELS